MSRHYILCVDDEKIILDSLKFQLKNHYKNKFELEFALSGAEALAIAEEIYQDGDRIAITIADYSMPDMNGSELLNRLHSFDPSAYSIVLTGQSTLEAIITTINSARLFRFIDKPWDQVDLFLAIDKAYSNFTNEIYLAELSKKNAALFTEMRAYYISTITALSNAVGARDSYAKGHSKRVAEYSCLIGGKLGMDDEALDNLSFMSILHDIGKIGISDKILLKQGQLDTDEYEIMKEHVAMSVEIISGIDGFAHVANGVYYHHERFDGNGYSTGLSGVMIPLESRILCITDAFDAMTTDRPYRKAMSRAQAVDELTKHSGTQFDPQLVDIFVDALVSND